MRILVHHDGQQLGPYTLDEARAALAAGTLRSTDLAWQEGTPSWVPLAGLLSGTASGGPPTMPGAMAQPGVQPAAAPTSGLAITSLVLGILSIMCLSFLSGIPAVICGHIARSQIKRGSGAVQGAGLALAGLIMGYISLAMLPIMAALAIPAFAGARQAATEQQSVNNARMIAIACQTYAAQHEGAFPAKLEELVPDHLPETALNCPILKQPGTVGYHYYGGTDQDPADKVLLVSKGTARNGKRIVARVDGTARVERLEPPPGAK